MTMDRTATTTRLTLHVDRVACDGRGLCLELLPEVLEPDPWGYPMNREGSGDAGVPRHLAADAQRAVRDCPRLALRLRDG